MAGVRSADFLLSDPYQGSIYLGGSAGNRTPARMYGPLDLRHSADHDFDRVGRKITWERHHQAVVRGIVTRSVNVHEQSPGVFSCTIVARSWDVRHVNLQYG